MSRLDPIRRHAPQLLGAIRLFNGATALLAPSATARRLGTDPEATAAPLYPLRVFGVRTVVLGIELLWGDEQTRTRSLRVGRFIHASDTISAAFGGIRRQLPARVAILLTLISLVNTALAFLGSSAAPPAKRSPRQRLPF
jgi:uncharacterized protein YjeT (DUF2065 family)